MIRPRPRPAALVALCLTACLAGLTPGAAGEPVLTGFRLFPLQTLGGAASASALWTDADNALFLAAGSAVAPDASTHAVYWENGVIRDLGLLGGTSAVATGIAGGGGTIRVVGTVVLDIGVRGFTWENGSHSLVSPNPLDQTTRVYSATQGGDSVGSLFNAANQLRGGIWSGGGFQEFAALTPTAAAEALAANGASAAGYSSGDTFVRHACLFDTAGGPATDLGTLGGTDSLASDLNAFGLTPTQVVGESRDAGGTTRPFFWQAGAGMRDLGTLGGASGNAYSIDALGNVVGRSQNGTGAMRATFWPLAGAAQDLNSLLLNNASGVALFEARGIDNRQYVVARGTLSSVQLPYFLIPVHAGNPRIDSLAPTTGNAGQSLTVLVNGAGFTPGATADLGAGITVNSVQILSPPRGPAPRDSHISRINLTIAAAAAAGPRSLVITNPNGGSATALNAFTVNAAPPAPALAAFTLEPTTAAGGSRLSGQVTLTLAAPSRGAKVTFTSSNPGFKAPKPVTVPRGQTTLRRPFAYKTKVVRTAPVTYTVTASYGGASRAVEVTLNPRAR